MTILTSYYRKLLGDMLPTSIDADETDTFVRVFLQALGRVHGTLFQKDPPSPVLIAQLVAQVSTGVGMLAVGDEAGLQKSTLALEGLDALACITGARPSLVVAQDQVDVESYPVGIWRDTLVGSRDGLQEMLMRVGRIDVPGTTVGFTGTGFLVADDTVMTCRHVLEMSAARTGNGKWKLFDGAAIDFGHELGGRRSVRRRRLSAVVFCGAGDAGSAPALDLALIQLEPAADVKLRRSGLAINFRSPGLANESRVYLAGYSGNPQPGNEHPNLLDRVYSPQFGYKRLGAGVVYPPHDRLDGRMLRHDVSRLGLNSGSVLVALGAEWVVLGIHSGRSSVSSETQAIQLSSVLNEKDPDTDQTLREALLDCGAVERAPRQRLPGSLPSKVTRMRKEQQIATARLQRDLSRGRWTKAAALPGTAESTALLQRAEEAAAVSGSFHPDQLLRWGTDETRKLAVLSELASSCEVETFDDELRWVLQPDRRTEVLRRLESRQALKGLVARKVDLPETDSFGDLLREVLREGRVTNLSARSPNELLQLTAVANAVQDLQLPEFEPEAIHRQLARGSFLREYDVLLDDGFVGRKNELRELRSFLSEDPQSGALYSSIVLTGIGGSGKSTLLGKFAREVFQEALATIVVLDFDRPGIDSADTEWLSHEVARQIGRQYSETSETLRSTRQSVRQMRADTLESTVQSSFDLLSQQRSRDSELLGEIRDSLHKASAAARPLLLIFDTFEVVSRNPSHVDQLEQWLDILGEELFPIPLRVIFSGRPFGAELLRQTGQHVSLEELPKSAARKLLVRQNVEPLLADALLRAKIVPQRPLELKLLAMATTLEDSPSLESLNEEVANAKASEGDTFDDNELRARLRAGLIYRRVLQRIADPLARRLAYPGLVLRYVSLDLIMDVLSPELQLNLTRQEAERALAELKSQPWLVQELTPGQYWHRNDLRRLMMRLLSDEETKEADRISRRAARYFGDSSTESHLEEAVYHRLRLIREPADGDLVDLSEVRRFAARLRPYEEDLSATSLALMKLALNEHLPDKFAVALPRRYFRRAYAQSGRRLIEADEFRKGLDLYRRGRADGLEIEWHRAWPVWEVEALFETANWDELREVLPPARSADDILELITLLFPSEVMGLESISANDLSALFSRLSGEELHRRKNNGTRAVRLAMSLLLLNARDRLTPDTWRKATSLCEGVADAKKKNFAAHLDSRIRLLSLAGSRSKSIEVRLAPSTLNLNPTWLKEMRQELAQDAPLAAKLVADVGENVKKVVQGRQRTARRLLSAVDAGYKHRDRWLNATMILPTNDRLVKKLLRGPDLEFRTPLRYALLDLYQSRDERITLAGHIASLLPYDLIDSVPETFADLIALDPEHALAPHIELLDRTWQLGELIRLVREEHPDAKKLLEIASSYGRWDRAVVNAMGTSPGTQREW